LRFIAPLPLDLGERDISTNKMRCETSIAPAEYAYAAVAVAGDAGPVAMIFAKNAAVAAAVRLTPKTVVPS